MNTNKDPLGLLGLPRDVGQPLLHGAQSCFYQHPWQQPCGCVLWLSLAALRYATDKLSTEPAQQTWLQRLGVSLSPER